MNDFGMIAWPFLIPIVAIIGWMVCLRTGLDGGRFWPGRGGSPVTWWSVGLPVTAVFAMTVASIGRRWSLETSSRTPRPRSVRGRTRPA